MAPHEQRGSWPIIKPPVHQVSNAISEGKAGDVWKRRDKEIQRICEMTVKISDKIKRKPVLSWSEPALTPSAMCPGKRKAFPRTA